MSGVNQPHKPRLPRGYRERKLLEPPVCARPGCSEPPAPDSDLCAHHRDDARVRKRRSQNRLRSVRGRAKLCRTGCGNPANRSMCPACTVRYGRAPRPVDDNREDNTRDRTWKDPDGRTRYHGQLKQGRQTNASLDAQDLSYGIRILQRAVEAIPYLTSQEVLAMGKVQRDGVRQAWLDEVYRGARHVLEPMARHRGKAALVKLMTAWATAIESER